MDIVKVVIGHGLIHGSDLRTDINGMIRAYTAEVGQGYEVVSTETKLTFDPNRTDHATITCTLVFRKKQ